jgi:hypothetical protein
MFPKGLTFVQSTMTRRLLIALAVLGALVFATWAAMGFGRVVRGDVYDTRSTWTPRLEVRIRAFRERQAGLFQSPAGGIYAVEARTAGGDWTEITSWRRDDPAPIDERVVVTRDEAVHLLAPDRLVVTADGGRNWLVLRNEDLRHACGDSRAYLRAVVIRGDGTGELEIWRPTVGTVKILKSRDFGATWE